MSSQFIMMSLIMKPDMGQIDIKLNILGKSSQFII